MTNFYKLHHRKPVQCGTVLEYVNWIKRQRQSLTRIRFHKVGNAYISTVFLGVNMMGCFFETAILDEGDVMIVDRAKTHREALINHRRIVTCQRAGLRKTYEKSRRA